MIWNGLHRRLTERKKRFDFGKQCRASRAVEASCYVHENAEQFKTSSSRSTSRKCRCKRSKSPSSWLGVLALQSISPMFVSLNYAADFVRQAADRSFSFMTYEQDMENKPRSKSSRRWQVNAASRPQPAMCSVAHRPSMKSVGWRRQSRRSRRDADAWTHRVKTCFPWQHG